MHKHFSARVVAGLAIFIVALLGVSFARADELPIWVQDSQIYINKVADVSEPDIPSTFFAGGNLDCAFVYDSHCSLDARYGSVYDSSLWVAGKWRPVADNGDNRANFYAVPNSDTAITASNSPVFGSFIYFTDGISTSLIPKYVLGLPDVNLSGENRMLDHFQLNHPPDRKLADKAGTSLATDLSSMGFSGDSQWMVVTDPGIATLRVNVNSGSVLPFGTGFSYEGRHPQPQNAITSDGRYAAVASTDFSTFTIYDLSTCTDVPINIAGPATCQHNDLFNFLRQQIPSYIGASHLRFLDDETISFYASYKDGTLSKTAQYTLSTKAGSATKLQYLAVGDSYISGEGAFNYLEGTDTPDNQCHVSLVAYPNLLGQELSYDSYHSVACSGATTKDVVDTSDNYAGQLIHKFQRKRYTKTEIDSILTNFQPGYIDQLDFVKQYQPKLVTISVGGDDTGFTSILKSCLEPFKSNTCYNTYEDRLELVRLVNNTVFPNLVKTYTSLKSAGPAGMRLYVIGYPQIAKPGGDCALNVHLTNEELIFSQQIIDYLDSAIKQAAAKAGVFYVDTQDAFYGHRLCEAGPGSIAMNGLSSGNDIPEKLGGPIGRESYHPNAYGYQLLNSKILSATHNLSQLMPAANASAAPPAEQGAEILNAPHSGRVINAPVFDPGISADLAYRQVPLDVYVDGSDHFVGPNSTLSAELHSTPTNLGSFTADSSGSLSAQIRIPADVPAGYHTLHFYGIDISGQSLDIYKDIYVANTADDLDGNGVADSAQTCVGIPASGQDYDKDGIDDACDGNITQPPAPTVKSEVSGSISAQGGVLVLASAQSSSSDSAGPTDSTTIAFIPRTQSIESKVLGASTTPSSPKPSSKHNDNLRVPNEYFAGTGLAMFLVSGLVYGAKRWLF